MDERIGFYQFCENMGSVGRVSVLRVGMGLGPG